MKKRGERVEEKKSETGRNELPISKCKSGIDGSRIADLRSWNLEPGTKNHKAGTLNLEPS